ncbi:MAG: hypothetical protein GY758_20015 [Fuerstiella sp.]|nr:hypothetical protein [Fuerstiella sp.]MCP4507265.1 hypothetical protein [Fuerstiella sp.]
MMRIIPVPRQTQRRTGTLFHYYLTYLFLTSVLLTTTGLCLHTVLKADRLDNQASAHLKTLLRLEGSLRTDATAAVDMETTATELKFYLPEADSTVRWVALNNVLTRENNTADTLTNSDRFVFHKGTSLEFSSKDETAVRLILTEPPRMRHPEDSSPAGENTSHSVEFLLFVRPAVVPVTSEPSARANESDTGTLRAAEYERTN